MSHTKNSFTCGRSIANAPQVLRSMVVRTTAFGAFAGAEMLMGSSCCKLWRKHSGYRIANAPYGAAVEVGQV